MSGAHLPITGPLTGGVYNAPAGGTSDLTAAQVKALLGMETNEVVSTTADLDELSLRAKLRWLAGFDDGPLTWALDENGAPVDYHAAPAATPAQLAATAPGTDSTVWIVTQPDGDPVAAYNAARDA